MERAIEMHRALLARTDLTRAERAHALASLGTDYRRAGFLDRAGAGLRRRRSRSTRRTCTRSRASRSCSRSSATGTRPTRRRPASRACARRTTAWCSASCRRRWAARRCAPGGATRGDRRSRRRSRSTGALSPPTCSWRSCGSSAIPGARPPCSRPRSRPSPSVPTSPSIACGRPTRRPASPRASALCCERLVAQDPRDWRARLALARQLRDGGKAAEAHGLLLRAVESNPHLLILHLEVWRTLHALGRLGPDEQSYLATVEDAALYVDPAHLHGLPLPRGRHALALPALPRVEHVRRGARGARRTNPLSGQRGLGCRPLSPGVRRSRSAKSPWGAPRARAPGARGSSASPAVR